ncbi:cadherin-related family member 1 isoform X2 [Fundulus heteroclitus]|uniref:cadherin-related family member 1 isoform X2 n=1 Tax=Fundulus heteroclitus TaxID=8078 RepID=UPI00165CB851|nr:cadherin-related family member 1 isoform X2 [Fundulus heteroclitus]
MKNVKISNLPLLFVFVQACLAQADYAPYFYDNDPYSNNGNLAMFSLSEDTPVGTQIYRLNGTDPEGQEVRFGLSFDQGSKEYFRVDPKSGNITLVEKLDREEQDSVDVNISITDGRSEVVERVTIFVMDANDEKPEFQNMPAIIDVLETTESGKSIYKVEAVDRDTGSGGSVTYHLQTPQSSLFAIDINSGVLRIKSGQTLDYEKTKTHFVTIVAKDGGGNLNGNEQFMSSTATLTVNVIDAQDTPPFFIGTPYFGYVYEISVPGSEIFTVSAEDGDVGNPNPVSYSFDEGDDGVFGINETSGCISLLVAPIYLKREIFNIKVRASEVSGEDKQMDYGVATVVIRVVDLNNNPPTFYGENGPQNMFELTMYEHPPEGEILRGLKITVNDSDKLLAVEIDTPERFSATADIVIHLLDTNDNAPKFSSDYYIARIPENSPGGSNVVSVTAVDPDSGPWGEVKYSIYGSGADLFLIQPISGIIYTQPWASLDAEVRSKYNFYVKAEDAEGKYSLAEVFVTVLDLNDHPPAFNDNFLEKTMVIGAPVKIQAVDDDAEVPNNVIEYAIMKAEPDNNIFDIDADTGEIKLKSYIKSLAIIQNITKKRDCSWSLVVQARDRGQPSFSTTAVVKIDITEATQLKGGPLGSFLLLNRNNPLQIIGMLISIICFMVIVTVIISTATFLRNKKSNRILPNRRVRRRPRKQHFWNFKSPFKSSETPRENFTVQEEQPEPEVVVENVNYNNNINNVVRHWPPPPCAPSLPPPPPTYVPGERHWTIPTVSAAVAPRPKKRPVIDRTDTVNKALVSELKMRLEQKKMATP